MKRLMDMERGGHEGSGARKIDTGGTNPKTMDYVRLYKDALREGVEEIAREEHVGIWEASKFTLDEVTLMLKSPEIYEGNDIPNEVELVRLKKILSARKVIQQ